MLFVFLLSHQTKVAVCDGVWLRLKKDGQVADNVRLYEGGMDAAHTATSLAEAHLWQKCTKHGCKNTKILFSANIIGEEKCLFVAIFLI